MGRRYLATAKVNKTTSDTAPKDLFQVASASTKVTRILGIHVEQSNRAGDANAQQLELIVERGTAGTGGTSITARPLSPSDGAFGGTVLAANTSAMSAATTIIEGGMNNQAGWHWTPAPGNEIELAPSGAIALVLATTPTASTDFEITFELEELG